MAGWSVTRLDEVRHSLGYHHGGYVGVGPDYVGHYGGVGYAEVGDAADAEVGVYDGHGVVVGALLQVPDMW